MMTKKSNSIIKKLTPALDSPWFYVLVSFYIVGSGHCLLRKWRRGILFFVGTYGSGIIGLVTLADDKTHPVVAYCLIVLSIMGFWANLIDSYRVARRHLGQLGTLNERIDRGIKSIFFNLVFPGVGFFVIRKSAIGIVTTVLWLVYFFLIDDTHTLIEIAIYTIVILITTRMSFPSFYLYVTGLLISTIFAITQLYAIAYDSIVQDTRTSLISGNSSWPTLRNGDVVLKKAIFHSDKDKLGVGELVSFVFDDRQLLRLDKPIKRIIATAGDTVRIVDGKVYVNKSITVSAEDEKSSEDFIVDANDIYIVPPFAVFVVGDNLEVSFDSRHFGAIPVNSIVSKPTKILWPLSRTRLLSQ